MQLDNQELKTKALGVKLEKINSSSFIYRFQRMISFSVSCFLTKFFPTVRPNHVSLLAIISVLVAIILGLVVEYLDPYLVVLIQLLVLFVSAILDKIDGELARIQQRFSQRGIYYDIVYHLLYVLALYFIIGLFFFVVSSSLSFLLGSTLLGFLMAMHKISGKVRHHIRFKINLEGHEKDIVDFGRETQKVKLRPVRWVRYLVFMIYDWVWIWYVLLVWTHFFNKPVGEVIYIVYTLLAILMVLIDLLWNYPKHSLFTREEV
ncbi:MAG: hypothetical protein A2589_02205 [Candidatus Vogelbacteria bacterium RIFOXYD1_FULL_46_19]|uniref:CDP-alcohol phosphatidyltransferase n=1 Tax=Candidatus Vogelbacteria bacterium RIFOXYD1_FULL_46_19 TaxID=1802439 RepID=A0A1G2QGV5_9BACT|nr:MAG: hypothetical protein A2589_02205 [Candidatus Vogelbacteria bacterium RIFOXYD1_FULL_46_19]